MDLVLDDLSLTRVPLTQRHYKLEVRLGDHVFRQFTDDNLGHLMAGCSRLWKDMGKILEPDRGYEATTVRTSPIHLNAIQLVPSLATGERWTLTLVSGPYSYTASMSDRLEDVMKAFMGAMGFFSFKYGVTTLDPDVVRNRERAVAGGFATKEDQVKRKTGRGWPRA